MEREFFLKEQWQREKVTTQGEKESPRIGRKKERWLGKRKRKRWQKGERFSRGEKAMSKKRKKKLEGTMAIGSNF
jgi:hypothetical protein